MDALFLHRAGSANLLLTVKSTPSRAFKRTPLQGVPVYRPAWWLYGVSACLWIAIGLVVAALVG
jgi:hypothetical protein